MEADNKATKAMHNYNVFKERFTNYLKTLFTEIDKCSLDENYMPLIDDNKMTSVSSASLKVAIRITYILALLTSNCGEDGSHVGFLLLDSPKDKDLDDYRFEKYLGIIGRDCEEQILITGSVSDREIYKKELVNAKFFEELTTEQKLFRSFVFSDAFFDFFSFFGQFAVRSRFQIRIQTAIVFNRTQSSRCNFQLENFAQCFAQQRNNLQVRHKTTTRTIVSVADIVAAHCPGAG